MEKKNLKTTTLDLIHYDQREEEAFLLLLGISTMLCIHG